LAMQIYYRILGAKNIMICDVMLKIFDLQKAKLKLGFTINIRHSLSKLFIKAFFIF